LLKAQTEVVVKHENHTPIGAFKVRGGDRLKRERPRVQGIVTATRGKHGQSLAFAGTLRQANWIMPKWTRALWARARPRSRRRLWHRSPYIEDDIAQYFSALAEFMCQGDVAQWQALSNRVN
jgi:hypothetical protein